MKQTLTNIFSDNQTLDYSAQKSRLDVVNSLLRQDAVIQYIAKNGALAMERSAYSGHLNVVNRYLQFPAVVQSIAAHNNRILYKTARNGHIDVAVTLLNYPQVLQLASPDIKQKMVEDITPEQTWRVIGCAFLKQHIPVERHLTFIHEKVLKHPVWMQVTAQMRLWSLCINRQSSLKPLPPLPSEIKRHIGLTLLQSSHPGISNDLAKALISSAPQKQLQTLLMP